MGQSFYGSVTNVHEELMTAVMLSLDDVINLVQDIRKNERAYFINFSKQQQMATGEILAAHSKDTEIDAFLKNVFGKNNAASVRAAAKKGEPLPVPLCGKDTASFDTGMRRAVALCFLAGYSLDQTNEFLQKKCGFPKLHLRNYQHIIYYYFLSHRGDDAFRTLSGIELWLAADQRIEGFEKNFGQRIRDQQIRLLEEKGALPQDLLPYTRICEREVRQLTDMDSLDRLLSDEVFLDMLGSFNLSAYKQFHYVTGFIKEELLRINHETPKEKSLGDKEISREGLFFSRFSLWTPSRNPFKSGMSTEEYAKAIKDGETKLKGDATLWSLYCRVPSMEQMANMLRGYRRIEYKDAKIMRETKTHLYPVSREALILVEYIYVVEYVTGEDKKKNFWERFERINTLLIDCGFHPLYPRDLFDYIIITCLDPEGTIWEDDYCNDTAASKIDALAPQIEGPSAFLSVKAQKRPDDQVGIYDCINYLLDIYSGIVEAFLNP